MSNKINIGLGRSVLFALFVLLPFLSFSQQKETEKAAKALTEKRYTRALKLSEKALKKNSKDPLALMYKSQSLYYLYKTPATSVKYKNGLKDALKAAEKALATEKSELIETSFRDFLALLATENNTEGEVSFRQERYSKAVQHFRLSVRFNPDDTAALFYLGSCYWFENQRARSLDYFKKVAQYNFSAFADSVSKNTYQFKAFRYLAEYYMGEEQWDSAGMYLAMGLEMFPEDHVLKGHRYGLHRVRVRSLPPSLDYLAEVRAALVDYPSDSFFLTKENALYIFLFKQSLKLDETRQADSLLGVFTLDRIQRAKRHDRHIISKYDVFTGDKPEEIFKKLLDYTVRNYHRDIFAWLSPKWVSEVANKDFVSGAEYLALAGKEFDAGNRDFAALMLLSEYQRAGRKGEEEKQILDLASKWAYSGLPLLGLDYVHELLEDVHRGKQKNRVESVYRHVTFLFIDSLAANNYFFRAYERFAQALKEFPADNKFLKEQKQRELANLDFKLNYYGSRIASWGKQPKEGEIAFESDILPSNCEAGTLSDELLERVAQRVNYFRRVSGVRKPIYFIKDLSVRCQFAALTFEANRNLSHTPADGLRCLTEYGKEAAEKSLLVKDNNPSIAITALMGDKHPSQGNRRWLQFPLAVNMGFGAGPNSQVLWVMDEANKEDTAHYKQHFVLYPSAGFTPKMLCFPKWTFSLFDDLAGATVKVRNEAGKELPVKVEPLVAGYGMPTLVFEPEFELDRSEKDQKFSVTVKLKNGKTYSYNVTLFTPKVD